KDISSALESRHFDVIIISSGNNCKAEHLQANFVACESEIPVVIFNDCRAALLPVDVVRAVERSHAQVAIDEANQAAAREQGRAGDEQARSQERYRAFIESTF